MFNQHPLSCGESPRNRLCVKLLTSQNSAHQLHEDGTSLKSLTLTLRLEGNKKANVLPPCGAWII